VVHNGHPVVVSSDPVRGTKAKKNVVTFVYTLYVFVCALVVVYILYSRISYVLYYYTLCSVRCNFIEKRFNRIKKPINSVEAAVVILRVNRCTCPGLFFFFFFSFLSHAHSNPGRDCSPKAVKSEHYPGAHSLSLAHPLFFNRSLITKTRYIHTHTHTFTVYTSVILYYMINTRPRLTCVCVCVCVCVYCTYIIIIIIIALTLQHCT